MFTSLVAALLTTLAALLAPHAPTPAVSVPAHVGASPAGRFDSAPLATRPQGSQGEDGRRGSNPQAPTSPPTDVAEQQPGETNGRQIDCTDGVHVGVMIDGAVTGCP